MEDILKSINLTIVIIVAITGILPLTAEEGHLARTIEVTGMGLVTQSPDLAKITLVVETQDASAEGANRANAAKTDRVIRALKKLGVSSEDLQTSLNSTLIRRFQ